MYRPAPPVRHWSGSAAAGRSHSRAPPNVLRSRDSLLRGRRQRAAFAIEHRFDLGKEIEVDHLIANVDRISKALGVGSAMAFHDDAVQAKHHTAIRLGGVELVAQCAEGGFCEQIA